MLFVVIEQENLLNFEQDVNEALEKGFELINCSEGSRLDEKHLYVAFLVKKK